jgi:hypothetical protein
VATVAQFQGQRHVGMEVTQRPKRIQNYFLHSEKNISPPVNSWWVELPETDPPPGLRQALGVFSIRQRDPRKLPVRFGLGGR